MGTGGPFSGVKAARAWSWPLPSCWCRGQENVIYTSTHPYAFMALVLNSLSTGTNLLLLLLLLLLYSFCSFWSRGNSWSSFSLQFLIVIDCRQYSYKGSAGCKAATYIGQSKRRKNSDILAVFVIHTHDPRVWAAEVISCLRPRDVRDRGNVGINDFSNFRNFLIPCLFLLLISLFISHSQAVCFINIFKFLWAPEKHSDPNIIPAVVGYAVGNYN
jgi:hypothetical protein